MSTARTHRPPASSGRTGPRRRLIRLLAALCTAGLALSIASAGTASASAGPAAHRSNGGAATLTNGGTWKDIHGNPIDSGSGNVLRVGKTYYLYGQMTTGPFDVSVYESTDLVHWRFVNQILTTDKTLGRDHKPAADLQAASGNHFERIKVIYDAATRKYVFWSHYENADYTLAEVGTAYSSSPTGDFTWAQAFHPAGLDSRDESVFVDNDGTGYLIGTSGGFHGQGTDVNSHLTLFKMTRDYLGIEKAVYNIYGGAGDSGLYAGREAPALVYSDGYYYLVTSGAAGWYPSPAMYSVAKARTLASTSPSSWQGDTNIDASSGWDGGGMAYYLGNRSDFGGQPYSILTVSGSCGTSYLLMNDILEPQNNTANGRMWLPLTLRKGVATVDYSQQVSINTRTGQVSNVYDGTLISQNKPATASLAAATTDSDGKVNAAGWTAGYANDGNYNTEYIAASTTYPWYWQVDLGAVYSLSEMQLSWWLVGGSEATEHFTISVSNDGTNWTTAYSNLDGVKYGFNDADLAGAQGRYVRVTITDAPVRNGSHNTWYTPQLWEAKVYGKPAA